MDCEEVRNQFSSLWEKELAPFDEKGAREHLSSCPECQREFEQFEKTMGWLHSLGEVEVPDGFLLGLHKKMEERKRIASTEKSNKRWLNLPLPLKLPVQAAAMVAVVFFVLYLTKMTPRPPARLSMGKKSEQVLAQKELEKGRGALKIPAEVPRPKDVGQAKGALPEEEKFEPTGPRVVAETKKAEAPSPKTGILAFKQIESKEAAKASAPSPGPEKIEKELFAKKSVAPTKPLQEIVLKISDREKAVSQLQELVKQFGGEMFATKGNGFLASLPAGSFSDFEKELEGVTSARMGDKVITGKQTTGGLRSLHGVEKEAAEGRSGEPVRPVTGEESRILVRILLIQE